MAANFADSFLSAFKAARDIRYDKEDRDYRNEQRARQRKEDGRKDEFRDTTGKILSGENQVATDKAAATISAADLDTGPSEGLIIGDVPGGGALPAQPKSKGPNITAQLADSVKGKIAALFGGDGTGTVARGMPTGDMGAMPELTRDSTSKQIGATREMNNAERLRAMSVAAAQVDPTLALSYSREADKQEAGDRMASIYASARTDAGAIKAWAQVDDGSDLTVGDRDPETGMKEYFSNGQSLGQHANAQDLFHEKVLPIAASLGPETVLQLTAQMANSDERQQDRDINRTRYDRDFLLRKRADERDEERTRISGALAAGSSKLNALQQREAEHALRVLDDEEDLTGRYKVLLKDPYKNRQELAAIEQDLALNNPKKFLTDETKIVPDPNNPDDLSAAKTIRVQANVLQLSREDRMPKLTQADAVDGMSALTKAIAAGEASPEGFTKFFDHMNGDGATDMLRDQVPEFAALFDSIGKPPAQPAQGSRPSGGGGGATSAIPTWDDVKSVAKSGRAWLGGKD